MICLPPAAAPAAFQKRQAAVKISRHETPLRLANCTRHSPRFACTTHDIALCLGRVHRKGPCEGSFNYFFELWASEQERQWSIMVLFVCESMRGTFILPECCNSGHFENEVVA